MVLYDFTRNGRDVTRTGFGMKKCSHNSKLTGFNLMLLLNVKADQLMGGNFI
jgi:hypothetical protein